MKKIMKGLPAIVLMLLIFCFAVVSDTVAEEFETNPGANAVADVTVGPHGITFQPKVGYMELVLTVSTPSGIVVRKVFTSGVTPMFELTGNEGDGSFTYELRVVPRLNKRTRGSETEAGLEIEGTLSDLPMVQSGYFSVLGGKFVTSSGKSEIGIAQPLDQVILDDLIVDGSACVGMDCVNGESFGFDTLRLKENNLRIRFVDTSSTSSFPSRDWQITVNDSANGGANKFSIDDIDSGRTPFTIEGNAPSNSLYVEDSGQVGIGTATPVADLHVVNGNTPTLRLEQNGSSGFTPQTWDVAGNEANFFIRDATNGSELPFRIVPGAPSNSLYVNSSGNVGIGTSSPGQPLSITRGAEDAGIIIERSDNAVKGQFSVRSDKVMIGAKSAHQLNLSVANDPKLIIDTDGDVAIGGSAAAYKLQVFNDDASAYGYSDGGAWLTGSSRKFKKNIMEINGDVAMDAFKKLTPVRFRYKGKNKEEHLGFIAEDVPEIVSEANRDAVSAMDIVSLLTKVVQQQQQSLETQEKTISELKKRITELEKK